MNLINLARNAFIRKNGFSLVELMVTLIVIACIAAAMTPVITKKLKSTTVSIQTAQLKSTCDKFGANCKLCYPDKCVSCDKTCLNDEAKNIEKCICEKCTLLHGTNCKKCDTINCVECISGYYVKDGKCEICPVGSFCDGLSKTTCANGQYSNTTGNSSCKNCEAGYKCINGIKTACSAGTYSEGNGATCTNCQAGYKCPGASNRIQCTGATYQNATGQATCLTCSSGGYVTNDRKNCKSCEAGYYCSGNGSRNECSAGTYQANAGQSSCTECPIGTYQPYSKQTKCNSCSKGYKCPTNKMTTQTACSGSEYQSSTGQSSCLICGNGKIVSSDHTACNSCPDGYGCDGANKTYCSAGKYSSGGQCKTCEAGYYCTGGSNRTSCPAGTYSTATGASSSDTCQACMAHCSSCNQATGACSACEDGYRFNSSGVCIQKFPCSGADFMQLDNGLCVTRRNIGDSNTYPIPSGIGATVVSAGTSCSGGSCCWQGQTADACNSENGDYSGCNRTVCRYNIAPTICSNLNLGYGYTWRLATEDEYRYMENYSRNLGNNGLQFCVDKSGFGLARCEHNFNACPGAESDNCRPYSHWTSNGTVGGFFTYYNILSRKEILSYAVGNKWDYGMSVRCVTENN